MVLIKWGPPRADSQVYCLPRQQHSVYKSRAANGAGDAREPLWASMPGGRLPWPIRPQLLPRSHVGTLADTSENGNTMNKSHVKTFQLRQGRSRYSSPIKRSVRARGRDAVPSFRSNPSACAGRGAGVPPASPASGGNVKPRPQGQ